MWYNYSNNSYIIKWCMDFSLLKISDVLNPTEVTLFSSVLFLYHFLTTVIVPKQLYRNTHVDLDRSWASPESRVAMKNSLRWHEEGNQTQKGPRPLLDDSRLYVYKSLQYSCVERMFSTSRVLGWVDRRQSLRLQQHFYVKKMYLGEIKHCSYFKDYNRKHGRMF